MAAETGCTVVEAGTVGQLLRMEVSAGKIQAWGVMIWGTEERKVGTSVGTLVPVT